MSATVVNSWNEFDPLKHVIVGRADNTCIPPNEAATEAKVPEDSDMRGMWGPRPLETVEKANVQLDALAKILTDRGITVDRPTPLQWNQAVVTPDFMTASQFGCMPPRDVLLTIGSEILSAPMSFRCRFFEYLAYHDLMQRYFDEDPNFKWEQAPRPRLSDDSYQQGYFDEITIEERLARTAALDFVTTEKEPLFDAADVMRLGKDLFCQHGLTTNRRGMQWLERHFPDHRIHAVNFPGDPYPIHIDATFVPLRPGLIINNPNRRLPEAQRKIFEANDWEIVDAAQPGIFDAYDRGWAAGGHEGTPKRMLAIGVFCADTQEEAELLAGTAVYRKMTMQMGEHEVLLSPEVVQDKRKKFPASIEAQFVHLLNGYTIGTPERCKTEIESLAKDFGTDEVAVVTVTHDFAARLKSYRLLSA